jgi:hypothetical protein
MMGAFRALTGNPLLLSYGTEVFDILGYSEQEALLINGLVVGVAQVVGAAFSFFLIERSGRRPIMIGGALAMGACNTAAAIITGVARCSILKGDLG